MNKIKPKMDAHKISKLTKAPKKRLGRPLKTVPPKRNVILYAALMAFAHHGVDRVSLRQIAEEANVNVSLLVHQFGSKMGLWKSVIDHAGGVIHDAALDILDSDNQTTRDREALLLRTIDHLVDTTCDVPERGLLLIQDIGNQGERFEYVVEKLVKPTHDLVLPLIRRVVLREAPEVNSPVIDPEFLTFILAGAIATAIAMRPLIARFTNAADDDATFRLHLKAALRGTFFAQTETSRPPARSRKTLQMES